MTDVITDRREHGLGIDTAVFSPDRVYRYALTREWGPGPAVAWAMPNPSTASAMEDDATIAKIRKFTRRLRPESGGLVVVNLFSLRSTEPRELWTHPDPIGPLGNHYLFGLGLNYDTVIAAWGTFGAGVKKRPETVGRGNRAADRIRHNDTAPTLYCLGTTKDGHPCHPLYLRDDTALVPYAGRAA